MRMSGRANSKGESEEEKNGKQEARAEHGQMVGDKEGIMGLTGILYC